MPTVPPAQLPPQVEVGDGVGLGDAFSPVAVGDGVGLGVGDGDGVAVVVWPEVQGLLMVVPPGALGKK